jgi:myosin heavy subunit
MAGTINVGTIQVGGLKELKAELKAVRDELLGATDPKRMQELATAAGELKDRIGDANEQITVFASGSKFEQVSNSFGSLKDSIMNLDFEEASQKAKIFQTTVTSISPETISKGMSGLASTVSTLGKTFVQFGVMLLTNPIFLLVAAIVAIVAGIAALMNALGILQPILDAIGAVFGFIADVIGAVVQAIKDFLDWMGLTDFAAEEAADAEAKRHEEQLKRNEEMKASRELNYNNEQNALQRQIDLQKAQGKETYLLEIQKLQASVNYQAQLYNELAAEQRVYDQVVARLELQGLMNTEIGKEAKKRQEDAKKGANDAKNATLDAVNQMKITTLNYKQSQQDQVKESQEAAKKIAEARADALEKIQEMEDKFRYNQLDERKKELEDIDKNYKEAFELAKKYGQDTTTLLKNYNAERQAVNDKFDEEEKKKLKEQEDALASLQRELGYKNLTENEASRQKEIDSLNDWYAEKLLANKDNAEVTKQLTEQQLLDQQGLTDKYAKEDAENIAEYTKEINALKYELNQVGLSEDEIARQNERADLEKWYTEKMELAKLDAKVQEEIKAAYIAKQMELNKQEKDEAVKLAIEKGNAVADATKESIGTVNDVIQAFAGESEKQQEKAFKINKAANIAMSVIDTLKGAVAAYSSQIVAGDPTSIIRGAIAAAMVTAAGIANIKKIASTQFKGASASGASGGVSASGGGGAVQPATPQTNLFGQGNNMNTLQGAQSVESQPQVVKAVVVESDITSSQSRIKRMEENATL